MSGATIFGRNPALIVGLIAALINVIVVVFSVPLTGEQVATLNAFAVALVAVIANASDPTTASTLALTLKKPDTASSIGRASSTLSDAKDSE